MVGGGVALRGAFGWRTFGGYVICAWIPATTSAGFASRAGGFAMQRWPCSVGATARLAQTGQTGPYLELDADVGVALGAARIEGRELFVTDASTRLEAGGRLGIDGVFHLGRDSFPVAPVVGVEATYLATAYHLIVSPGGAIAETPRIWLGVTVGASWELH